MDTPEQLPEPLSDDERSVMRQKLAYAFELLTDEELHNVNPWLYIREYAGDVHRLLADNDRLSARIAALREFVGLFEGWLMNYATDDPRLPPGVGGHFSCVSCNASGRTFGEVKHTDECIVMKARALLRVEQ